MPTELEQLCAPTRRYQDLWEECTNAPFEYTEVQLAVHVEEFLIYHWDWEALCAFLIGGVTPKILWITEHTFLVVVDGDNEFDYGESMAHSCIVANIEAASGQEQTLSLGQLEREDILTGGDVSIFWRAVANSNSIKLTLHANRHGLQVLPSGPILSRFLRGSPSLQVLEFEGFDFEEEHCRALATLQRHNIQIKLDSCKLDPHDAEGAFIEWFRHNQVVTELVYCNMGSNFLSALSGNNSVKKLLIAKTEIDEEMRCLAQALTGNVGIERLILGTFQISDETWILLFRSLTTHPRINYLHVIDHNMAFLGRPPPLSAASMITRMNAILQMLQHNTVVHTIELPDAYNNGEVYQNSILPRLEMNRTCFEVQRQAVKRADPSIRPQLLGRALFVVRYNPELIFLFLSENVPAFVRTEEEDDTAIPLQNDPAIVSGQKKRKAPS
jgi:hypothetical protein